jgi:hypothetical protein
MGLLVLSGSRALGSVTTEYLVGGRAFVRFGLPACGDLGWEPIGGFPPLASGRTPERRAPTRRRSERRTAAAIDGRPGRRSAVRPDDRKAPTRRQLGRTRHVGRTARYRTPWQRWCPGVTRSIQQGVPGTVRALSRHSRLPSPRPSPSPSRRGTDATARNARHSSGAVTTAPITADTAAYRPRSRPGGGLGVPVTGVIHASALARGT